MQEAAAHSTIRVVKTVEEPEPEGASAHRGPTSLCITPQWIAGTLSVALYWAWFFVTMFSDAILLPLPASLHIEPIFRSACFLGILASLVFLQFFARTILKRRRGSIKILTISLVASPWLYVVTSLTTSADMLVIPVELLIWLLEGIALGSFLFLTSAVIVNSSVRSSMFTLGIAATIGAALYMMISYIQQPHAFAITACIPFLCAFTFCTSGQTDYQESEADQQRAIKPMSSIIDSFAVQPAQPFYGLVYGLAVSVGVSIGVTGDGIFPAQTAAAFCLAGPALVMLSAFAKETTIETIQWILLPIAVAGLLCVVLGFPPLTAACCAILAFCWNFYDLAHTLSLSEFMAEQQTIEPSIFTSGKILVFAGTLIGWSISAALLLTDNYSTPVFSATLVGVAIAAIVVISYLGKPGKEDREASPPPLRYSGERLAGGMRRNRQESGALAATNRGVHAPCEGPKRLLYRRAAVHITPYRKGAHLPHLPEARHPLQARTHRCYRARAGEAQLIASTSRRNSALGVDKLRDLRAAGLASRET